MGRRNRESQPDRSLAGTSTPNISALAHLSKNALRDDSGEPRACAPKDRDGARMVAQGAGKTRQIGGSPAALPAHHVRSREDPPDRILSRNRKLLTPLLRPSSRRSTA